VLAEPFVNWGRWVANCPAPDCSNAEHYGVDGGYPGGLGREVFRCSYCGLLCPVQWPPLTADIERLLVMRPVPATRNWLPGETLLDLMVENLRHGIYPAGVVAGEGSLMITEHGIVTGRELLALES
jgi:hypothetical protein